MSIIKINLNNKVFDLFCEDGQEKSALTIAESLDRKIAEIKTSSPHASYELLLVMTALSLEEKLKNYESLSENASGKAETEEFAKTLTEIAGYLENLAKKIG